MAQTFTSEQRHNAAIIIGVGKRLGATPTDIIVALMTAMQESGLRNVHYGDRDSLGLFQQRPSQGWGTPAQVLDPVYAATQFYTRLLAEKGHGRLPLTVQAQSVQRSAYPDAYAPHEGAARMLYASITGDKGMLSTLNNALTDAGKVAKAGADVVINPLGIPGDFGVKSPISNPLDALKAFGKVANALSSKSFWVRAAYVLAGIAAIIVGLAWLNHREISSITETAAKGAVLA